MNRIAALLVVFCLFCLSTVAGWLTRDAAPSISGGRPPAIAVVAARRSSSSPLTPQDWRDRLERNVTGNATLVRGPYSGEGFEGLWRQASEPGGSQQVLDYAEGWVRHNPATACAWLDSLRHDYLEQVDRTRLIFDAWAKQNVEAALVAASRFSQAGTRAQALVSVLQVLAKTDPERARSVFTQHLELLGMKNNLVVSLASGEAGKSDFEFLRSLPAGKARANLLAEAMEDAAFDSDLSRATSFWNALPRSLKKEILAAHFLDESGRGYYAPYTEEIRQAFPGVEGLRREIAEAGTPRDVQMFINQYGNDWAARDLPAAIEWTRHHSTGTDGMSLTLQLFRSGGRTGFDTAMRLWQELPEGVLKMKAIGAISRYADDAHKSQAEAIIKALPAAQQALAWRGADY